MTATTLAAGAAQAALIDRGNPAQIGTDQGWSAALVSNLGCTVRGWPKFKN